MKKRSPIAVYLLTLFTGSIYFFFWIFLMMHDINVIMSKKIFDIRKNVINLLTVFVVYLLALFVLSITRALMLDTLTFVLLLIGFIMAIYWFVLIIRYLRQISNQIELIENSQHNKNTISKTAATILFFIYLTAVPYIQSHMNKVIESRSL